MTTYRKYHLPVFAWSGAHFGEDTIVLVRDETGKWSGHTEVDQCVKRDLCADEITSIRREFANELRCY